MTKRIIYFLLALMLFGPAMAQKRQTTQRKTTATTRQKATTTRRQNAVSTRRQQQPVRRKGNTSTTRRQATQQKGKRQAGKQTYTNASIKGLQNERSQIQKQIKQQEQALKGKARLTTRSHFI